ncbi:MAG: ABC transporter permease [Bdellovibrionaceae bacterium]|nr:ABC transporter permease [Pseudobdellovibrionaceae bacterium]
MAHDFLVDEGFVTGKNKVSYPFDWKIMGDRFVRHLYLTFFALFLAILLAVPLGVLIERSPLIAQPIIALAGLMQTIPSIALLVFMIPVFGIGVKPAIVALLIYSILPILRNTYVGIKTVDREYLESARGLGLSYWETLFLIKFPLSLPVIIAGIRTAAVINIGTATLAAFIGAGGLGEPIVTGLSLNDTNLILQGAIPAAVLAIFVEIIFSYIERRVKMT